MAEIGPLRIHYHRDFDGMVSAAVLACILRDLRGEDVCWESVNYDQRSDWENFERGRRFAIVDFHFHPRAEYWFDHPGQFVAARKDSTIDGPLKALEELLFSAVFYREVDETVVVMPNRGPAPDFYYR